VVGIGRTQRSDYGIYLDRWPRTARQIEDDGIAMAISVRWLASPSADPAEAAAWSASDEGKQFMSRSSEAWHDASVAAGTRPDEARVAADRTTAFYIGVEPAASASS
jgi:hypothetical protein